MSYLITSIEQHKEARDDEHRENARRLEYDVSDCALSSWASNQMAKFHGVAIDALERGKEWFGVDWPAGEFPALVSVEDGRELDAKEMFVKSFSGYGKDHVWRLSDREAARYGRRFVPFGANGKSRILKQLGLRVDWIRGFADREMGVGAGAIGAPVHFYLEKLEDPKLLKELADRMEANK